MGLTKTQQALITKARTAGASDLGVGLDDGMSSYLVAVIVRDLKLLEHFPELPSNFLPFFGTKTLSDLRLDNLNFQVLLERLIGLREDADTYFFCLAALHKARLKYERILQAQAIPTIDQVGPRSLLQYGVLNARALAGFLFWRKWLFDIDNRAGQETGYLFEPIVAHAIGGVPYSARKSPIKRGGTGSAGRQVDCVRDHRAYEIKLRVTIAASGQGRWREELEFPNDCKASGYTPVLIVLDPTPNPKLYELSEAFTDASGEVYVGQDAWEHLAKLAGSTMARFLQLYVHEPLEALLKEAPDHLPEITLTMDEKQLTITLEGEKLVVRRNKAEVVASESAELPDDVDEQVPGI